MSHRFYKLSPSRTWYRRNNLYSGPLLIPQIVEWAMIQRGEIQDWPPDATAEVEPVPDEGYRPDPRTFSFPSHNIYITARMVELFRGSGLTGFQILPVQPFGALREKAEGMCILHIVNLIPALDELRSQYSYHIDPTRDGRNRIVAINKPVVIESAMPNHLDVFRLLELPTLVFVSQKFKDVCDCEGVDCWIFEPPNAD